MEEQFTVLGEQIKALITQLANMGGHNGDGSGHPSAERTTKKMTFTNAHLLTF
jgi:hypothetical protein